MDELVLKWNDHINTSALFRQALREEMRVRNVDPHILRELLNRAEEQGYCLEDIAAQTNRLDDLEALIECDTTSVRPALAEQP
ncbi:hypothetical protein [Natrialbaceae archaeon AArc-T1-2]|uniref:hypothetical protein n=1 Tax=Natrialbaceae archaeon AArc-T1-2 TaxID=3053904 RepID=UPI00255B1837|nr:hypothetical protein [Natrialbaceae archaeon AArc-T1-2]WIV68882.1 hypothetical protein QQ977_16880 [Natrialbaceae archaeon AArc-T1-2]